jgi:hypothetical protein
MLVEGEVCFSSPWIRVRGRPSQKKKNKQKKPLKKGRRGGKNQNEGLPYPTYTTYLVGSFVVVVGEPGRVRGTVF